MRLFLLLTVWICGALAVIAADSMGIADKFLPHPRLILTPAATHKVMTLLEVGDPWSFRMLTRIRQDAKRLQQEPPCKMTLSTNRQLLNVSREVLRRVIVLGMVWRLDHSEEAGQRLLVELDAVANAADWNPEHFLDTAEMTLAVALGYDWGYDLMTSTQRRRISEAIIVKGLKAAMANTGGMKTNNNWNQVRYGGMIAGAMAVYEDAPAEAAAVLRQAKDNYLSALNAYGHDGVYAEGPIYWAYGTTFSVVMAACLESATGDDWGISHHPEFIASFDSIMQVTAPSGKTFNYADSAEELDSTPVHLWLAEKLKRNDYAVYGRRLIEKYLTETDRPGWRLAPLALLWHNPDPGMSSLVTPEVWSGGDQVVLAVLRTPENNAFLGIKGGIIPVNHGHMDIGSFVYEVDGERWSSDLGPDFSAYTNPRFFDLEQQSKRWSFFRLNNFSHNTLTIGGALQQVSGNNPLVAGKTADGQVGVVLDMTAAYHGQATVIQRGVKLFHSGALLVQDEFVGLNPSEELRWHMMTAAKITISDNGHDAILSLNNKKLSVRIMSPAAARFEILATKQGIVKDTPNPAYQRLSVVLPPPVTDGMLTVVLCPAGCSLPEIKITPLAQWQL